MRMLLAIAATLKFSLPASAQNQPCSGKNGGIAHCAGDRFVCNDGSIGGNKKICTAPNSQPQGLMATPKSKLSTSCGCRSGRFCTGPRGGKYCYSDSGKIKLCSEVKKRLGP